MGYVFDFNDAVSYEEWFKAPRNRFAVDLENRLIDFAVAIIRTSETLPKTRARRPS